VAVAVREAEAEANGPQRRHYELPLQVREPEETSAGQELPRRV